MHRLIAIVSATGILLSAPSAPPARADELPSWNEVPSRAAIVEFVEKVTKVGSPDFVAVEDRIAVFDNDGTLWAEQPAYFQLFYAIHRVKAMATGHPEWKTQEPFKSLLAGDVPSALAGGEKAVMEIVAATHSGMTLAEFEASVREWIATARHPVTGRRFTEMIYQPMLELLGYLRLNGFTTYIVSGGGIEFMRPWVEATYGVPPERVIGSSLKTTFELRDGTPVLVKQPEIGSVTDGPGKPVNINLHIGRRPIAAFGNSDGDLQMLQWTAARGGAHLCLLVHHTDAGREWRYDRDSSIGRLDKALDAANRHGWTVVDMKKDWSTIFVPVTAPSPPVLPDL
ncbi:MAG: haloacid dehalogenase-like hydrolase [Verrucomicrobiae bacterium]|nr:haloacid dehalogenase-like hydrolase [Verrucomicrobiae bacterium]